MNETFLEFGNPLSLFQSQIPQSPFPPCPENIPQFLMENLIDKNRVIKLFQNDPQAPLRIFYYQYLKLCFQLQQTDYETYINKIEQLLINPQFHFLFPSHKNQPVYQDLQFKRFIMEFMEILDDQNTSIEYAISRFPIMDQVLVLFLRSILIINNKCQGFEDYIPRQDLFQFLASFFGVDIALYQNCLKFIDSDVFIYQQNPYQVYMIYIDYQECSEDTSNNISNSSASNKTQPQQTISDLDIHNNQSTQNNHIKSSSKLPISNRNQTTNSGIYDFVDYTQKIKQLDQKIYIKNQTNKTIIKEQLIKPSKKQQPLKTKSINQDKVQKLKIDYGKRIQEQNENIFQEATQQSQFKINSISDRYKYLKASQQKIPLSQISHNISYLQQQSKPPQVSKKIQISYQKNNQINYGLQITQDSILNANKYKYNSSQKRFFDIKKQNYQFHTFIPLNQSLQQNNTNKCMLEKFPNYLLNLSKQFTNSIILKSIKQPYQTNIKMMKARARAQRNAIQLTTNYWK